MSSFGRTAREDLAAAAATIGRDAREQVGVRRRMLNQLLGTVFQLVVFSSLAKLVRGNRFATPEDYVGYVAVGLVGLAFLQAAVRPPVAVREQLLTETLERVAVSGFGAAKATAALLGFPFLYATASGVLTVTLAGVVFGVPVDLPGALLAFPLVPLIAFAFAPIGLAFGAVAIASPQATLGIAPFVAVMTLVSGAVFPVDLLPRVLRWAGDVQPFRPAIDLLRHVILGTAVQGSTAGELLRLAVFGAVALPLAATALQLAVERARRRGDLREL